ncbi:methyltransferase domain-containing protein [Coleofasciculus sp. FACHB-64]|uniref:class I SAM-dependent methyltransferase n=1 Tax=Cyanophyceae TaxID=3028117 RepID=UPI0016844AF6|nr:MULTISPECIES: methyltransferase domain-containing protein [unclassified Coleofasciculus]MBD1838939.1 methyltransferase domain-containing protein [Coleofasciculus sp. FACHB-501]MBD2048505.1 methyltransferase domain-containing protein [Coleofasciculus sp. FACHB-64]
MSDQASELLERIRQQFDTSPYPRNPLDESPKDNASVLYIHNLATSYYKRNQRFIETKGKVILDAGCGSGYKSLILAEANPGAKIVGIDLSEESVKLSRQRLQHHGFENAEFYTLLLEDLPTLGIDFDYINNDEVLYLLPDPVVGLQAMKAVLKPDGIIRTNLHSSLQRSIFFRAQEVFKMMGFMDENPQEMEIGFVREAMGALKDQVLLKSQTWHPNYETQDELILANHLLLGDKGSTIPEMFSALKAADLEFISMVQWRQWDLMGLFKNPDDLPAFLALALPETSMEEQLHLFELLHPVHRLLDLWCGHLNQAKPVVPISEWTTADWQEARVHLHPQLKTPKFKEDLVACISELRMFEISRHLPIHEGFVNIDSSSAVCLLPLLNESQSMMSLVERWKQVRPVHPVTLEPTDEGEAFEIVKHLLTRLESLGYVLLECRF